MIQQTQWTALALCFGLAACSTADKYSFIHMGQTQGTDPNTGQLLDPTKAPALSDGLALNYASCVASLLRSKFNVARDARELSSTVQVTLAALAGAGAAFSYGSSAVAALGLSSALIPDLQKIFDAKGHAQTYQDAVRLIEEAEIEYLSLNQNPSSVVLTQNGVTLFQRVTATIHVVEKTLAGNLPSVEEMQRATELMSREGAKKTAAGAPVFNHIPANSTARPIQKLTPVVINTPVQPAVTRADDVQAVVQSAGAILRQLSKDQAQKALNDLKPGALESPNPQEEITGILIDTKTMNQALKVLKALQQAQKQ